MSTTTAEWFDYSPEAIAQWLAWLEDHQVEDPHVHEAPALAGSHGMWSDLLHAYATAGTERPWFAEGAIARRPIVMLSGPEESCKSWTAIQLSIATITGGKWLERFAIRRRGSGVYLDGEYGEHEFARRAARLARGMGRTPHEVLPSVRHLYSTDLTLTRSDPVFRRVLADVGAAPPSLIVLDPLRNHLDGSENDSDAVIKAYRCLADLRDAGGCPVLVIHHLNKSGGFSGSRAITTRADLISEGSDGEMPTYSVRGRTVRRDLDPIAREFTIEIEHENDSEDAIAATRLTHCGDAPDEATAAPLPPGLKSLDGKVLTFLRAQKEPRSTGYVAKALKRNKDDTAAALERLFQAGHVDSLVEAVEFQGRRYDGWTPATRDGTGDVVTEDVPRDEQGTSLDADCESSIFGAVLTGDGTGDEQGTANKGRTEECP